MAEQLHIHISYASPARAVLRVLAVPAGTTIEQAIALSGLLAEFPEIDLGVNPVGIYSKKKPLDTPLQEHDRIEIYRPLLADPKESRRKRAEKHGAK
ncbi:RnfH family protein [Massilia glaciei]|uniref:UPF0125 protein C7C56_010645 n=1 Tax=Massilia glaciei TaxID=1524097 RepID=A0A2U2HMD2_9BURK|nr:RnfH family protein [Massilia glaciei]PWF48660.1 RnfH family protein [Massilia glaciei]